MKKTIIALTMVPMIAFAITAAQKEAFNEANIKYLEKEGLPTPGSGVQVVPQSSVKMETWQKKKFLSDNNEMKNKGYVSKSSMRAHELMNIQAEIKKMQLKQGMTFKGTDSHMRQKSEDIPFAYTYGGVPKDEIIEFFGIAPVGTYVTENQTGWTGAVEFFRSSFAYCAYTENNMVAAHGAARIVEEEAVNDVNGKVTLIDIEGSESTGYLYRVNWFDNIYNRNLECATKEFSESIRTDTINLAKRIDSSQR